MCILPQYVEIVVCRIIEQFVPIGSLMFLTVEISINLSGGKMNFYGWRCLVFGCMIENVYESFIAHFQLVYTGR